MKPIREGIMKELIIKPGVSIGDITLGMHKDAAKEIISKFPDSVFLNMDCDERENVHFMEIASNAKDEFVCVLQDINVDPFHTKAKDLIRIVEQFDAYEQTDESRLGFSYRFPKLGLAFWRTGVLDEADLQESWFKEMSAEHQEDELRYLYFESVSVFTPAPDGRH